MTLASLLFGSPGWHWAMWGILLLACWAVVRSLQSWRGTEGYLPAALKSLAMFLLAVCLTEPLWSSLRTRAGANLFLVLADNSASLTIRDSGADLSRGEQLRQLLSEQSPGWQSKLEQEFDVRRFTVTSRLDSARNFGHLSFTEPQSSWYSALNLASQRFAERPVAGVLLFTDGIATDEQPRDFSSADLPPIYPVILGTSQGVQDLSIQNVSVSLTAFEDAPVTITAEVQHQGLSGKAVSVRLLDEAGEVVKTEPLQLPQDQRGSTVRFQVRPVQAGLSFYTLQAELVAAENAPVITETSSENNRRAVAVERGSGPYRVLYVSGRPNWEFKFLNRALEPDEQVKMTALIRIAKREPKFDWRGRAGESSNPLFRGFDGVDAEIERFDQPVIVRLNTRDGQELRDGFPKTADELFPYHAVILDDLESEFFTASQFELLEKFVSERGGSLLMLGGMESFAAGGYRKSPLARVLPVALNEIPTPSATHRWKLNLTRDGWLQPWARLRSTEDDERQRLDSWPPFHTLNPTGREKPGASVIAEVIDRGGEKRPAIVTHRYGQGRSAAVLLADLWRTNLQQTDAQREKEDLAKAWRQLVRWLIADVPEQISLRAAPLPDDPAVTRVEIRVKTADFQPQDNSSVTLTSTLPDGKLLKVSGEPSLEEAGLYEALIATSQSGNYRAEAAVLASDGKLLGTGVTGWVHDPRAQEFRRVTPDAVWLEDLARQTGGELVRPDQLERFVSSLAHRPAPITEMTTTPLWQHPLVWLMIVGSLCGEWGLRRWKGLP